MKRYLFILLSIIFIVSSCDFESGSTLGGDITVIDDQTDVKIAIDELGDEFQYVISEDFSPNDTAWFNVSSNINVAIASKIKDRNLALPGF